MAKDIYHKPTSKKQIISNLSKFIKIIDDSELSNNDKKLFKEMADKGIFIHYSGVPYKLRKWIEDSFKIEEEENVYKILFATETLFYGVNISTDCVILSKLKWPRDDPGNFTFEHLYLTPSEYHNILGRAGRPNHTHKCLHAYICVHAKEFDNDDIEQIINYYKGSIEARSKLFLDSDQQHYADKTITHLDDVSYPAFRSIIDAIRYLEFDDNTVTEADIKALLRKTVFYNNDSEEFISGILATIIEQSKKYKFNNTTSSPLLRTEGRGYKITQQAESLIVTGTHWRSIAPMYSWLFKLNKFNKEEDYSIETIIPALIAAPDLWKTLKQFCAEQEKKWEKEEPTEGLARNNEEYYSDILRSDLLQIFNNNTNKATAFIELIDHYIDEQESILQVYQYKFRKAMFLKLMSAFLKWLRGEEMDAISQLSILYNKRNPTKDTDNNLQTKYVEKANWLSIMMLNFFVDIPDILTKSQIRELPTLSLRLRYGVVSEAIPYIGGFDPSENRLDRKDIRNLMDNHITPNDLIKKKNLDSNFSSEFISKASNNVLRFHKQHISELAETFRDEGYDYWYYMQILFAKL